MNCLPNTYPYAARGQFFLVNKISIVKYVIIHGNILVFILFPLYSLCSLFLFANSSLNKNKQYVVSFFYLEFDRNDI